MKYLWAQIRFYLHGVRWAFSDQHELLERWTEDRTSGKCVITDRKIWCTCGKVFLKDETTNN